MRASVATSLRRTKETPIPPFHPLPRHANNQTGSPSFLFLYLLWVCCAHPEGLLLGPMLVNLYGPMALFDLQSCLSVSLHSTPSEYFFWVSYPFPSCRFDCMQPLRRRFCSRPLPLVLGCLYST